MECQPETNVYDTTPKTRIFRGYHEKWNKVGTAYCRTSLKTMWDANEDPAVTESLGWPTWGNSTKRYPPHYSEAQQIRYESQWWLCTSKTDKSPQEEEIQILNHGRIFHFINCLTCDWHYFLKISCLVTFKELCDTNLCNATCNR